MDIVCPACATAHEIDETALPSTGRRVRCASCGEIWLAMPRVAEEAGTSELENAQDSVSQDVAPPADEPVRRGASIVKTRKAKPPSPFAAAKRLVTWPVATLGLTCVVLGGAALQRQRVVALVPQAAPVFAAIGLPVNLRGIEIANIKSRIIEENGTSILVVDGDLRNVAGRTVDVPRLRFAILGSKGEEVQIWSAPADKTSLNVGETLNFRRRFASPPESGKDVRVRFLTPADITADLK